MATRPSERGKKEMMTITFTVLGQAIPQGSKKVVPIMRGGVPVINNGRTLTRAVNDNPKLSGWRQEIAQVGRAAFSEATGDDEPELLKGPVCLGVTFFRLRPRSHYGTGRNAGILKQSAPKHPTQRPDTLKLARAVEDALSQVIWHDDSQVVEHRLVKEWGPCLSVRVEITAINESQEELTDADRRVMAERLVLEKMEKNK